MGVYYRCIYMWYLWVYKKYTRHINSKNISHIPEEYRKLNMFLLGDFIIKNKFK